MSVVKVTEISSSSPNSFEDAINVGIARASQTLRDITGAWVNEQKVVVENGRVTAYRVNMKVSFRLEG
ncbi:MAG: dodecin family protein [Acidobacteriota bacterium]